MRLQHQEMSLSYPQRYCFEKKDKVTAKAGKKKGFFSVKRKGLVVEWDDYVAGWLPYLFLGYSVKGRFCRLVYCFEKKDKVTARREKRDSFFSVKGRGLIVEWDDYVAGWLRYLFLGYSVKGRLCRWVLDVIPSISCNCSIKGTMISACFENMFYFRYVSS
ncbi:hypothetical protein CEXT_463151 [Caerostris extrusa]|uniref:Uncharacterized protein n=1 Tax=Caerostris extrusa TaxID=172846 RepID=A0AAV4NVS9_CAEEX|nr:hypothetical protein CEXT_463151 [Caerostris extrusa]